MGRRLSLPSLALIAGLVLLPPAAPARAAPAADPAVQTPPGRDRTESPDTAAGGFAAIGCGFFVRASIATAGTQVGTIVGAVACCGYMLFDAFVVDPH